MNAAKKEEDDPVVKEIPVYLSKTLEDKLFILQYPMYPKGIWDDINIAGTFIKPENQKIRVELAMDTTNELSYDHSMGEQLALRSNGKSSTENDNNVFDSGLMDRTILTSERALSDCSNFGVGIFQDDELHITPLKTLLHMKLQCDYLDEGDKQARDGTKGTGEDDDEEDDNPTPVKVTFARRLPDNLKKLQEQSFQHHHKKSEEERWMRTNYYASTDDMQSEILQSTRMDMFCPLSEESKNTLNLSKKEYLHLLVPQLPNECYLQSTSGEQIDLHYIKTLPLEKRIKTMMKQGENDMEIMLEERNIEE